MKAGNYLFTLLMKVDGFEHKILSALRLDHDSSRPVKELAAYAAAGFQQGHATDFYDEPAFEHTDGLLIMPSDEPPMVCDTPSLNAVFDALDLYILEDHFDCEEIAEQVTTFLGYP